MLFTEEEYAYMNGAVFGGQHSGYKPDVLELPNGDGKVDATKRYAHVAEKYQHEDCLTDAKLRGFFARAHTEARRVAAKLDVPFEFWPDARHGALRILEYPVGSGSEQHTDFDLFTLLCYRNDEQHGQTGEDSPLIFVAPEGEPENSKHWRKLQRTSPGMHLGEIGELVGMGGATPHAVLPESYVQQSIVYFAIPDHAATLPSGQTVGEGIAERIARSRVYK